jgi:competence ComEA-like helix-hairpin-helix protein
MDSIRNRWIFVGSLSGVFVLTLVFSYGPGYGGNLLGAISLPGSQTTKIHEMSPSDMVTKMVTPKKMVTNNHVTNVTFVSPSFAPTPVSSVIPTTEYIGSTPTHAPTPATTQLVTPSASPILSVSPQASPKTSTSTEPLATTPVPAAASSTPIPAALQSIKVNINTADLNRLEDITGVGPAIAQRIIDYRTANGPFQKIEDVIKVKGIGEATFQKMKDQITVGA